MKKSKLLTFFVIIIVCIIVFFVSKWILKTFVYPLDHFEIVKREASKNSIDPYLVMAVIKTESGFNKNATSNKQAKGLMQIIDSTATDIKDKLNMQTSNDDIYDEDVNITLGCKYLSSLIERYNGNYYLAICAYNGGMGNVDKWIAQGTIPEDLDEYKNNNIPFPETKNYLNKVISSYKMYRLLY